VEDIKSEKEFEIDITGLIYGGDSMGRLPDGRAVFVAGGLPGERVRIRLVEDKPRFARGRLLDVLSPSPDRIEVPEAQARACGGCHYQHIRYEAQLQAKTEILRDQFKRIAGIPNLPIEPMLPSPKQWHYRNTVQLHLNHEGHLGFQEPGSHSVTALEDCRLCEEPLNEILPLLEFEQAAEGVDRINLRVGAGEDIMLIFEGQDPQPPEIQVELPVSAVHLVVDDEGNSYPVVMAGDDHVVMEVLGRPFRVSAGSFFQVNTGQAENMIRYLLDRLPLDSQKTLLEVYAGVGLFSAFLASRVGQLVAVEFSTSAVDDFTANLDEFENVALYSGLAEEVLPSLDLPVDVCLVDPPRAGLALPALDAITRLSPPFLVYVSCDPATLARDAKRLLAAGYNLERVQPFDMFPQTYHIESISFFTRTSA
jgi:23S rRNA (uracil1939-C5)-methyltransferase